MQLLSGTSAASAASRQISLRQKTAHKLEEGWPQGQPSVFMSMIEPRLPQKLEVNDFQAGDCLSNLHAGKDARASICYH